MPDDKGVLAQSEKDVIQEWLRARDAAKPCPVCGSLEWGIGDKLGILPLAFGNVLGGGGYPCVVLLCQRCAYTRLHNAILMGIAPPKRKEKKESDQPVEASNG